MDESENETQVSTSISKSILPTMNQDEFIGFWRIVYNLFTGMENEAEMYHAAATVSTLLLKLGEASRKFQSGENIKHSVSNMELKTSSDENLPEQQTKLIRSSTVSESSSVDHKSWCITFEQLVASLLTDNLLVQYFDSKYDVDKKLAEYKSHHA